MPQSTLHVRTNLTLHDHLPKMLAIRSPSPPLVPIISPPRAMIQITHQTLHHRLNTRRDLLITKQFMDSTVAKGDHLWMRASSIDPTPFSDSDDQDLDSPSDAARRFHECINGKDVEGLRRVLARDCLLEDSAFRKPFQGLKDVERLLRDVMAAMGENVQFVMEMLLEGRRSTAAIVWHLEWKGRSIPFSRGSTFFECENIKEKLTIKKVRVALESPLKPGRCLLELLRFTTAVFDRYPRLANGLLQEPYAVIQFVLKIYKMFLEPLILPVVLYYAHVWTIISGILRRVLSLVLKVLGIHL